MGTALAWQNLLHHKVRTAVGIAGVGFAVVLAFMQLGFRGSIPTTVKLTLDALDFDLLLRSPKYRRFNDPRSFPSSRLYQAAGVAGVERVVPLDISLITWQNPYTGRRRGILMFGVPPTAPAFALPEIQRKARLLTHPQFILVDRRSRREFGPRNGQQFSDDDVGTTVEVGGLATCIVGHFALGTGLSADGALLVNAEGYRRLLPSQDPGEVSLGLVKVRPGVDRTQVAQRLRQALPEDVRVLTREDAVRHELEWWFKDTSVGVIFQFGVVIALLVGIAIVYQVLASEVVSHMAEYATLKAMGYGSGYLAGVVLAQAWALAGAGFVAGLAAAQGLYALTSYWANLPIVMNLGRILGVLAMTVAMCTISGLGALRKLTAADPADLF